jgi:hypothetical protein
VTRQYLFKDENLLFIFVESDLAALNEIMSNSSDFIGHMKGPTGIPVTHRRKGLKLYKNCFTGICSNATELPKIKGDDIVTWLVVNKMAENRKQALHIGNALLNKRIFDHVTQKHYLEDSVELLYQFLEVLIQFFLGSIFQDDDPDRTNTPRKSGSSEVAAEIVRPKDSLADMLGTESESLIHYIFGYLGVNDFAAICRVSKRYRKQAYRYSTSTAILRYCCNNKRFEYLVF